VLDVSSFAGDTGAYLLSLQWVAESAEIGYGETVEGEITEAMPFQVFVFTGKAGDVVDASVQSDGAVDTNLRLYNYGQVDKDSGTGYDPELRGIEVTTDDAPYYLVVEAAALDETGPFSITLTQE
jgi:hypothetical protein